MGKEFPDTNSWLALKSENNLSNFYRLGRMLFVGHKKYITANGLATHKGGMKNDIEVLHGANFIALTGADVRTSHYKANIRKMGHFSSL